MPFGGLLTAGISAGGSILGGLFGGNAASKAAKQQAEGLQKGITFTQQQLDNARSLTSDAEKGIGTAADSAAGTLATSRDQQLGLLQPYSTAGQDSLKQLQDISGPNGAFTNKFSFNPSDLAKDPGFAFTLKQGQDAIARSAAATGSLFSGGTAKSLAGYSEGTANQYFNDAYQRSLGTFQTNQQQALNRTGALQQMAGLGYGATTTGTGAIQNTQSQSAQEQLQAALGKGQLASTSASLGLEGARSIAGMYGGQGAAKAAGTTGQTSSWLGALQGGTNAITGYLGLKYPGGAPNPNTGQPIGTLDRSIATQPGF